MNGTRTHVYIYMNVNILTLLPFDTLTELQEEQHPKHQWAIPLRLRGAASQRLHHKKVKAEPGQA